jgi:hypothetical protein
MLVMVVDSMHGLRSLVVQDDDALETGHAMVIPVVL